MRSFVLVFSQSLTFDFSTKFSRIQHLHFCSNNLTLNPSRKFVQTVRDAIQWPTEDSSANWWCFAMKALQENAQCFTGDVFHSMLRFFSLNVYDHLLAILKFEIRFAFHEIKLEVYSWNYILLDILLLHTNVSLLEAYTWNLIHPKSSLAFSLELYFLFLQRYGEDHWVRLHYFLLRIKKNNFEQTHLLRFRPSSIKIARGNFASKQFPSQQQDNAKVGASKC